jgi:hypothetical protein
MEALYFGNGHWANNTGASTPESPVTVNQTTKRPVGGGPWMGKAETVVSPNYQETPRPADKCAPCDRFFQVLTSRRACTVRDPTSQYYTPVRGRVCPAD